MPEHKSQRGRWRDEAWRFQIDLRDKDCILIGHMPESNGAESNRINFCWDIERTGSVNLTPEQAWEIVDALLQEIARAKEAQDGEA